EVVELGNGVTENDLLVYDERAREALPFLLSRLDDAEFPVIAGVFRDVERPTFDELTARQVTDAIESKGRGDLQALISSGETWTVA
ncbi:MAG TPA: 2-oxoacid:ferredoxin oxidoreductase subunit beta, partial [Planctomycetota bacterium]|nr:2-oxoacid:ferredoxin oxidoreductase subunit beta [Planctomycetota bacterium]